MTRKGTATFVKQRNGRGDGRVYKLAPPMTYPSRADGLDEALTTEYVWVSAASNETYIFVCDKDGAVLDWGELPGSFGGGLDHAEALRGAGYKIAEEPANVD